MLRILTVWAVFWATLVAGPLAMAAPKSIVVDMASGAVLSSNEAHHRWYPASLTKLMTAYVAFREVRSGAVTMRSPVKVSRKALSKPPSKMGYPVGSRMTLENALKMIIVKSANDIAVAIGESLYGSEAAFVAAMNREALRLGMAGTQFVNPNGLFAKNQYSTPRDFAILAQAIRKEFPEYAEWFSYSSLKAGQNNLFAYNLLLGRFAGADGMKTGYVCSSAYNIVATATRNGRTLIAVVMGSRSAEKRAVLVAKLLDEGFRIGDLGKPRVQNLPLDVPNPSRVQDMRPVVCGENAGSLSISASAAKVVQDSPYLNTRIGGPSGIPVRLGGADGPIAERAFQFFASANVPVPTPRPDYTPVVLDAKVYLSEDVTLRGTLEKPVPTPRPNIVAQ